MTVGNYIYRLANFVVDYYSNVYWLKRNYSIEHLPILKISKDEVYFEIPNIGKVVLPLNEKLQNPDIDKLYSECYKIMEQEDKACERDVIKSFDQYCKK